MSDTPLASLLARLSDADRTSAERYLRVFGEKHLSSHLVHRFKMNPNKPWFVFVGPSGAKFFTHFVKLANQARKPLCGLPIPPFIAKGKNNYGILF